MSCVVGIGRLTRTPGRLQFLRCPRRPPLTTLPRSSVELVTSSTATRIEPSAIRILLPRRTVWHSPEYDSPIRVSPVASSLKPSQVSYSSPTATTVTSCPAARSMSFPPRSMAVRISGPLVSSSTAAEDPLAPQTARKRSSTRWWSACDPWLKLRRATSRPASSREAMPSSLQHRGPSVQTTLVFRTGRTRGSSARAVWMRSTRAVTTGRVVETFTGSNSPEACRRDAAGSSSADARPPEPRTTITSLPGGHRPAATACSTPRRMESSTPTPPSGRSGSRNGRRP
mmetsp:Transcript_19515/g.46605  ORF Transcript_19515/g.46605 Transcript_19515/m.46605 type:complete len:285 (-) Transcript_19515:3352-4206(-)